MSEIKNGRLGLYGAEHLKCNHMVTVGFTGLTNVTNIDDDITGVLMQLY